MNPLEKEGMEILQVVNHQKTNHLEKVEMETSLLDPTFTYIYLSLLLQKKRKEMLEFAPMIKHRSLTLLQRKIWKQNVILQETMLVNIEPLTVC